jgi:hypothetical protein
MDGQKWWSREGDEWESWHGENWPTGAHDESKRIPYTPEEIAKFEAIMKDYDEWKAKHPPEPPRNILYEFITGVQAEIEFAMIIEKATGKETKL